MSGSINWRSSAMVRVAIVLVIVVLALHLAALLFLPDESLRLIVSDIAQPIEGLSAAAALFWASRTSRVLSRRLARAWGLLALAQLLSAMGDVTYSFLEIVLHEQPFPSLADPLYLSYYPLFIVGVMRLPVIPLNNRERLRMALDLSMVMLSAGLVFWNFWLGPIVFGETTDLVTLLLSVAYPVFDLILLFGVLLLLFRRGEPAWRIPQRLLAIGMAAMISADFIFGYRSIIGEYQSGELTDILWATAFGLCFLAAIFQIASVRRQAARPQVEDSDIARRITARMTYFPYLWLVVAYVLLTIGYNSALPPTFPILTLGFGVIVILAVVRQVLVLVENGQLTAQLRRARDALEIRVQERTAELARANADLRAEIAERKQTEEALRASEERYRTVVEEVSEGIILYDVKTNRVLEANPAYANLLGYALDEMSALSLYDIVAADREHVDEDLQQIAAQQHYAIGECQHRRKDGSLLDVEVTGALLSLADQDVLCIVVRDISARKRADAQMRQSLHEKEILLKEIHHRVKNNLQVVSSLLNLQRNQVRDQTTAEALRESQNRIRSMALIHEKLYHSQDLARADIGEYARNLAAELFQTYRASAGAIGLEIDAVKDIFLGIDKAIPVGLIINELVSNALKHAFPPGCNGTLRIELHSNADHAIQLRVGDNGAGLPRGFDFRNSNSLGLQLVVTLVDQLDGTIDLDQLHGTVFTITFPDSATR